jgi:hypothetical protein
MPYREGDDARRVHLRLVENLTVSTPCRERWDRMHGDERVRHCSHCSKDVHNLSAMSLEEIAALVERLQGKLCARFYRRPDGRLVTADCPPPNLAQRAAQVAGAAVVAVGVMAGAALVAAAPQSASGNDDEPHGICAMDDFDSWVPHPDEETGSVEVTGDVAFTPTRLREQYVDVYLASGATREAARHPHDIPDNLLCSRFNPAGSFDDLEIEAQSIGRPDVDGSCGWGGCRDHDWYADPCPIKRDNDSRDGDDDDDDDDD